ncbi:hypothetical protein J25TS5_44790 [Paenibacillus faecis]|nr:hypothetical protein J25TS5_44790 [Paenibacillus faecis]
MPSFALFYPQNAKCLSLSDVNTAKKAVLKNSTASGMDIRRNRQRPKALNDCVRVFLTKFRDRKEAQKINGSFVHKKNKTQ